MKLKEKLNKFIELSASSNRNYLLTWNENSEINGEIKITNLNANKEAVGKVIIENDQIRMNFDSTSYNESYLKKVVFNDLLYTELSQENILIEINIPKVGNIITTKLYINQLSLGSSVELPVGTYYYSVNSDLVNCNGWPLRKSFKGVFQGQDLRKCSNLQALEYTFFKLTTEIKSNENI